MSSDMCSTTPEIKDMLDTLFFRVVHLAQKLPLELFPRDTEQSMNTHLTTLLLALNARGVVPDIEKDQLTVQHEVKTVRDTIRDVLTLVASQEDERSLLSPVRRDELIQVIQEQSEVFPLVERGSIRREQIALWVARQLEE